MNRSEEINELALALSKAQGQIKSAPKDAKVGGKINYKYATLDSIWEVCRKPLSDNGLAVIQLPANENSLTLETVLLHSSGQWIGTILSLPESAGRMSELQAMGSALTYARRYMLGSIVGITTGDDDDGLKASLPTGRTQSSPSDVSNGNEMTLAKLLTELNRVERIKGFYSKPDEIMACRSKGAESPDADDIEGWRQLFEDARNYAFEQLDRVIEDRRITPDQTPMSETEVVSSAMDEVERATAEEDAQSFIDAGLVDTHGPDMYK